MLLYNYVCNIYDILQKNDVKSVLSTMIVQELMSWTVTTASAPTGSSPVRTTGTVSYILTKNI